MTDEIALKIMTDTYVRMVELKSCSPGEKSHMLAYHTTFVKEQIRKILKRLEKSGHVAAVEGKR